MVQPRQSSRPGLRGTSQGAAAAAAPPTRVRNARDLRSAYIEIKQSPDGLDPDPLTVPKCVECGHCGWPVYPRDSKVASKKTFARAGIIRGPKDKEKAATAGADEEGEEGEGEAGSVDSRDTVERMVDEIEDLKDKVTELEKRKTELEEENEELSTKLADTEFQLREALEKIEFMEEAEVRWREKLSAARIEIDRLTLTLDRASQVSADREGGLVAALQELRRVNRVFSTYRRRRDLMLTKLQTKLQRREEEDARAAVLRLWRTQAVQDKLSRELRELELRRQNEVREIQEKLDTERQRVQNLQAMLNRMEQRLWEAGTRIIASAFGSRATLAGRKAVLQGWSDLVPLLSTEKQLEESQKQLEEATVLLKDRSELAEALQVERDQLVEERDDLQQENIRLQSDMDCLKQEFGTSQEAIEARTQAIKAREEEAQRAVDEVRAQLKDVEDILGKEREESEMQIRVLESQLAMAQAVNSATSAVGGGGGGVAAATGRFDDEATRIVPRGQGVLCVGCLQQLVHRSVRPLPPVTALTASAPSLEKAKRDFFEKELKGAANPDDALHSYAFKARKDPYGVARLTVWPTVPTAAVQAPPSPTEAPSTPLTGLPALKKDRLRGLGGTVSSLRTSMKDFKPRAFR